MIWNFQGATPPLLSQIKNTRCVYGKQCPTKMHQPWNVPTKYVPYWSKVLTLVDATGLFYPHAWKSGEVFFHSLLEHGFLFKTAKNEPRKIQWDFWTLNKHLMSSSFIYNDARFHNFFQHLKRLFHYAQLKYTNF